MTLRLFEATGIELEYMVVDATTLDVAPVADELLRRAAGSASFVSDVDLGAVAWSNELVAHVLEMKTNGPVRTLAGCDEGFAASVRRANATLAPLGARLMPGAMHPWMNPRRELRLWPHESSAVYAAFDRIFGCQGHGWANLQSMHLNLPFDGDGEFGRLHAAIRVLLPILPALAASSPVVEGALTGCLDNRLDFYRSNAVKLPSLTGRVIPEALFTRRDYEERLLARLYADIAPHDPEGVLQDEFLNARGAIARFSRGSIEIRVLDVQECPAADLAVAELVIAVLRALAAERWAPVRTLEGFSVPRLERIFLGTLARADEALVDDAGYLAALGCRRSAIRAGALWRELAERSLTAPAGGPAVARSLDVLLERGSLARRLVDELGEAPDRERLRETYRALCECLDANAPFAPAS